MAVYSNADTKGLHMASRADFDGSVRAGPLPPGRCPTPDEQGSTVWGGAKNPWSIESGRLAIVVMLAGSDGRVGTTRQE